MADKIKLILQLIGGIALILLTLWYFTNQFSFIGEKLNKVASVDIPEIKNTLDKNSERADLIKTDMNIISQRINTLGDQAASVNRIETNIDLLSRKINDELISGIDQYGKGSKQNIAELKKLANKIDRLSRQYVKFLKLAEDKIIVSVPPKWIDELPYRKGTIFAVGISPSASELNKAQQIAADQARSGMAMMIERKTFNALGNTIKSAGKSPPESLDELSLQFRQKLSEVVNELLIDTRIENYWVDPAGYVYALISLPIEYRIAGSKFGVLIETLKLTHQSFTEVVMQDFRNQLKLELSN